MIKCSNEGCKEGFFDRRYGHNCRRWPVMVYQTCGFLQEITPSELILNNLIKCCRRLRDEWDWFEGNNNIDIDLKEFEQHLNNNTDAVEAVVNVIREYDKLPNKPLGD